MCAVVVRGALQQASCAGLLLAGRQAARATEGVTATKGCNARLQDPAEGALESNVRGASVVSHVSPAEQFVRAKAPL